MDAHPSNPLDAAVEVLRQQLETLLEQVSDKKKLINSLLASMGKPAMFDDVDAPKAAASGLASVHPGQFYGKAIPTAVKEYLNLRPKKAVPITEVLDALKKGGLAFPEGAGGAERALRISIGKNTRDFVVFKDTDHVGQAEWYPAARKPQEKKPGTATNGAGAGAADVVDDDAVDTPTDPGPSDGTK